MNKKLKIKAFFSGGSSLNRAIKCVEFAWFLQKNIPKDREVVVVGVGDYEIFADSIGPRCISEIQKYSDTISVYGNSINPMNRSNLKQMRDKIQEDHKSAFIIAIDASLGKLKPGTVQVETKPLKPAKGMNCDCGEIGDLSVLAVVGESKEHIKAKCMDKSINDMPVFIAFGIMLWLSLFRKQTLISIDITGDRAIKNKISYCKTYDSANHKHTRKDKKIRTYEMIVKDVRNNMDKKC